MGKDKIYGWKGLREVNGEFRSEFCNKPYVPGRTYRLPKGQHPEACKRGFHFGKKLCDVLSYCPPNDSAYVFARVAASGEMDIIDTVDDRKAAASSITIKEKPSSLAGIVSGIVSIATTLPGSDDYYYVADDMNILRGDHQYQACAMPEVYMRVDGRHSIGVMRGANSLGYIQDGMHAYSAIFSSGSNSYVLCDGDECLACVSGDRSRAEARGRRSVAVSLGDCGVAQADVAQSVAVSLNYARAVTDGAVALGVYEAEAANGAVALKSGHTYGSVRARNKASAISLPTADMTPNSSGQARGELGTTLLLGFNYRGVNCWYTLFVDGELIRPDTSYYVVSGKLRVMSLRQPDAGVMARLARIKPVPTMEEVDKLCAGLNK